MQWKQSKKGPALYNDLRPYTSASKLMEYQVAIKGEKAVVLAVEKKQTTKLEEERTVRKILKLDEHVSMAFAGNQ